MDPIAGKVVCVGAVVRRGTSVLMVRQAPGHSLAGLWSIPWGVVDSGEAPEDAALRETREEAGVEAELEGLLGYQNLPNQPDWIALVFLCRHLHGEPRPDGTETDAARYLEESELIALGSQVEPWCRWLALRQLGGACRTIPEAADGPYLPRRGYL